MHLLHTVLNRALDAHGALPQREMIIEATSDEQRVAQDHVTAVHETEPVPARDDVGGQAPLFISKMGRNAR